MSSHRSLLSLTVVGSNLLPAAACAISLVTLQGFRCPADCLARAVAFILPLSDLSGGRGLNSVLSVPSLAARNHSLALV